MNRALEGKAALLVGCGSGIGRAVLEAFLAEGARVVALELDETKHDELHAMGRDVVAVRGDATSPEDNLRAVQAAEENFGGLDVLATFVGVFDYYTPLTEIDLGTLPAASDEIFRTNVLTYLLAVRAAADTLRRRRGSIVLTLSTSSFYPGRGGPLYVASKYATRGLVVALGHELAPEVRVNGVAPGGTLNTRLRGLTSLGMDERALGAAEGREQDLRGRTPLQVAMDGADHAGAYVFLASDRSCGTTGTVIHSDGGMGVRG